VGVTNRFALLLRGFPRRFFLIRLDMFGGGESYAPDRLGKPLGGC